MKCVGAGCGYADVDRDGIPSAFWATVRCASF